MKRGVYLLRRFGWLLPTVVLVAVFVFLTWYVRTHTIAIFQPIGTLGIKERNLMILALTMSAIVVIPVFAMTIAIVWRYRESNQRKTVYQPDFDRSRLFESIWWGVPIIIIAILSVVTWNSSHALDPYRPLASRQPTLHIQVVALDWKWLFIYPDQHIATVNLAEIPVGQPVDFAVTSDTIMNSFWVPQLGGQIYAMPGMSTHLQAQATQAGDVLGSPANIAGKGFARMDFTVRAARPADFNQWVKRAQTTNRNLTAIAYEALARPSDNVPVRYYSPVQDGLYDTIVMKYMSPMSAMTNQPPATMPVQQPPVHKATPTRHPMSGMPGMAM